MTILAQTTRALEQLTYAIISLQDAARARDFFRDNETEVSFSGTLSGKLPSEDQVPTAILATEQLLAAVADPVLVLDAYVRQRSIEVLGQFDHLQASITDDLAEITGMNAEQSAHERAVTDMLNSFRV